jgi:hypothetical protein
MVSYTYNAKKMHIRKMDEKYVLNLLGFPKILTYFYMRILINYDYDMKKFKTHLYILMFYPFESTKDPIIIIFSSYFHIFEVGA